LAAQRHSPFLCALTSGLCLQNGVSLNVTRPFGASASMEAISTAYANKFGISSKSCKLYYQGSEFSTQALEQVG